ncbi:hypothetical protein HYQ46_011956 [Verticillium longisporum]|nr:hypothetical protein HYQ46_011956 [Verticillium longisporum]
MNRLSVAQYCHSTVVRTRRSSIRVSGNVFVGFDLIGGDQQINFEGPGLRARVLGPFTTGLAIGLRLSLGF